MVRGPHEVSRGIPSWIRRLPEKGGWPITVFLLTGIGATLLVELAIGPADRVVQVSVVAVLVAAMICTVRQTLVVALACTAVPAVDSSPTRPAPATSPGCSWRPCRPWPCASCWASSTVRPTLDTVGVAAGGGAWLVLGEDARTNMPRLVRRPATG
ncbi:hypothetical protein [Streptomyces iranensis]|uniref:Uncharacterized protein n=1 Tax=Streptomyces iranensis TaxID=576784 RepID=A0A060ZVH4_9ACTN|nr:hypothetical protein [Streptomyces iranensis]MBP2062299.1 hypothetical protein [Streptomyces iranensis]CDR07503.1 predicted protein [Streptomyces iranensis]